MATYRRVRRGQMRVAMKTGEVDVYDVIAGRASEWEEIAAVTRLDTLLKFVPGVGEELLEELIDAIQLRRYVRMQYLTFERRSQIAETVRGLLEVPDPAVQPPALTPRPPLS